MSLFLQKLWEHCKILFFWVVRKHTREADQSVIQLQLSCTERCIKFLKRFQVLIVFNAQSFNRSEKGLARWLLTAITNKHVAS